MSQTLFCDFDGLQTSLFSQCFSLVGVFPRKIHIGSSEVTVSCGLAIDGSSQIQRLDDTAGGKLEVLAYQFSDLFIIDDSCSGGIYHDGYGLCDTDGVSQLDLALLGKTCGNYVLCSVSCSI